MAVDEEDRQPTKEILKLELEGLRAIYGHNDILWTESSENGKVGTLRASVIPHAVSECPASEASLFYVAVELDIFCGFPRVPPAGRICASGVYVPEILTTITAEAVRQIFREDASCSLFELVEYIRSHVKPVNDVSQETDILDVSTKESKTALVFPGFKDPDTHAASDMLQKCSQKQRALHIDKEEPEKQEPPLLSEQSERRVYSGNPIIDRKSVFQAHIAAVHSREEVAQVMAELLCCPKVARATHNIMAYRIKAGSAKAYSKQDTIDKGSPHRQKNAARGGGAGHTKRNQARGHENTGSTSDAVVQDHDSDGEKAAGGRLQHLLEILGVTNVLVVVSRWYGGIPLGPHRFRHINNAARQVIMETGIGSPKGFVPQ